MTAELEWRRTWTPTLLSKPWRQITFCDHQSLFFVKCNFQENTYEICLTDLKNAWYEYVEEEDFKKRVEKLNPNMEAPVETLLEHIRTSMEDDKDGTKYTISFVRPLFSMGEGDGSKVLLTLSGLLEGVPFVWKFHLQSAPSDVFYEHMTKSLLTMVTELTRRQDELVKVIKNKDKEIEDYKSQGVRTSRKHIETVPFDETAFVNNMVNSQGFEDAASTFLDEVFTGSSDSGIKQLYRDIAVKQAWIERPIETKEDEEEEENFAEDTFDNNMETEGDATAGAAQSFGDKRLPPSLMGDGWQGKSPSKSDGKRSTETTPVKDTELMRREALERRLAEEEEKKEEKTKKKKKLGL